MSTCYILSQIHEFRVLTVILGSEALVQLTCRIHEQKSEYSLLNVALVGKELKSQMWHQCGASCPCKQDTTEGAFFGDF